MDNMSAADIAAVTRNNTCGYGEGWGGMGGGWFAWILLFALFGGGGFGGWGNRGRDCVTEADLCTTNSHRAAGAADRGPGSGCPHVRRPALAH